MARTLTTTDNNSPTDVQEPVALGLPAWDRLGQTVKDRSDMLSNEGTPEAFIKTRPGRAGMVWRYTDIYPQLRALRKYWPLHKFISLERKFIHNEVVVTVTLQLLEAGMIVLEYPGTGSAEVQVNRATGTVISVGDAAAAAETKAMKKAMSRAGVFSDIFGDDADLFTLVEPEEFDELIADTEAANMPTMRDELINLRAQSISEGMVMKDFITIRNNVQATIADAIVSDIERNEDGTEHQETVVQSGIGGGETGEVVRPAPTRTIPSEDNQL